MVIISVREYLENKRNECGHAILEQYSPIILQDVSTVLPMESETKIKVVVNVQC